MRGQLGPEHALSGPPHPGTRGDRSWACGRKQAVVFLMELVCSAEDRLEKQPATCRLEGAVREANEGDEKGEPDCC